MRRMLAVVTVIAAVAAGAVALGFGGDQGTPTGTPPLQKYHITAGDLPAPTGGVANPPEVVDTYDDPKMAFEETKKALMMISKSFGTAEEQAKKINLFNKAQEEIQNKKEDNL